MYIHFFFSFTLFGCLENGWEMKLSLGFLYLFIFFVVQDGRRQNVAAGFSIVRGNKFENFIEFIIYKYIFSWSFCVQLMEQSMVV